MPARANFVRDRIARDLEAARDPLSLPPPVQEIPATIGLDGRARRADGRFVQKRARSAREYLMSLTDNGEQVLRAYADYACGRAACSLRERLEALKFVAERIYGKTPEVSITATADHKTVFDELSVDQLHALADSAARAAKGAA
jgi:hypothetical protein